MTSQQGGRRSAVRRRLSPTAVVAALIPLLTVGALLGVRPDDPSSAVRPAEEVPPTRVDLVCPAGEDDDVVVAATAGRGGGEASVSRAGEEESSALSLAADGVSRVRGGQATFLRATGELAAEMIGARVSSNGLSSAACVQPRPDYWFTGLGAGADHASVLELANPDDGPAVADVQVWGRTGLIDVPALRGITVPGGEATRLDLAEIVPRRGELAIHVAVSRGRLGASVLDRVPPLGSRPASEGWLPDSEEPATEQLLLGLAPGEGEDTLVVANPGEDEARVEVRVVTEDASFVPEGQPPVRVAAGSVETVTLSSMLRGQVSEGAVGLQLSASAPIAASLRSVTGDDLVHAPVTAPTDAAATALVPAGEATLVLARAGAAGLAVVTAYDAQGRRLTRERVELAEGSGATLGLPARTRLVQVVPRRTDVAGSVVVTGSGATVVPLRDLRRRSLIPDVRPGLPG